MRLPARPPALLRIFHATLHATSHAILHATSHATVLSTFLATLRARLRLAALLIAAVALGAAPGAGAATPAPGVAYLTLPDIQATEAGARIEVTEFFAYYCPHCDRFEPLLAAWAKQHGAEIVFKRVHVSGGPGVVAQQKLFYALEALGLLDEYHAKVFQAIHRERLRLDNDEAVFDWAAKAGIERARFVDAYNAFGMAAKLRRAERLMADYRIDSWPTLAVGGRYLTSPSLAGAGEPSAQTETAQQQAALKVLDVLVAKAQAEKK